MASKPPNYYPESVYSNSDHELDNSVVELLKTDPELHAQHAAWDFCGYIWWDPEGERWIEEVWVYQVRQKSFSNVDIEDMIREVNDEFGWS
jgi:hypothetical protein